MQDDVDRQSIFLMGMKESGLPPNESGESSPMKLPSISGRLEFSSI
jgi:hypothetical protein